MSLPRLTRRRAGYADGKSWLDLLSDCAAIRQAMKPAARRSSAPTLTPARPLVDERRRVHPSGPAAAGSISVPSIGGPGAQARKGTVPR